MTLMLTVSDAEIPAGSVAVQVKVAMPGLPAVKTAEPPVVGATSPLVALQV
jgi:hypothetical protein